MTNAVHPDIATVALQKVDGFSFEKFANQFFSAQLGESYIPLGGVKDGGADGFVEASIFEAEGRSGIFFQASTEEDPVKKIEKTLARLKEFGRKISTLYYVTNQMVKHIDKVEDALADEHAVNVKIRDQNYILSHLNDSDGTRAAYQHTLAFFAAHLSSTGSAEIIKSSPNVLDPTPYVFLSQEVGNRLGNKTLIHTVCDSLILWALNDTDPDKGIFRSREEVRIKIISELPWAKHYINQNIDQRLELLSKEKQAAGASRRVQFHIKKKAYCLPHDTRSTIALENAGDIVLKSKVKAQFLKICEENLSQKNHEFACDIAFRTLERFYENQGLLFVDFLAKRDSNGMHSTTVAAHIGSCLDEANATPALRKVVAEVVFDILRRCFYQSTTEQREYLSRLSRTYILLFTMRGDPRIVEFFQNQVRGYRLFVGTDVLLLALTERFVKDEDRRARNLLKLAKDYGCKLYLSEPILQELFTHIRATVYEFDNHIAEREPYLTGEITKHSDRILIRTYFYAKHEGKVKGWKEFLNTFVDYQSVRTAAGMEQLKSYLVNQFNLEYVDNKALSEKVDGHKVEQLAKKLLEDGIKDREDLAQNDALMVHAVYSERRSAKEMHRAGELGYRTWWLTQETRIQRATVQLVIENAGARYIMRPAFLLNYFSLCPSATEIRKSYKGIFPTILGLQMGHRLSVDVFHKTLKMVDEWRDLEEGRRASKIKDLSETLQTDHVRIHDFDFDEFAKQT